MEYIDLHMHSTFSDGTDSPEELVNKAVKAGLKMIALTDHNTFAGIDAFRKAIGQHNSGGTDSRGGDSAGPGPGRSRSLPDTGEDMKSGSGEDIRSGIGEDIISGIVGIAGIEISTGWIEDLERTPGRREAPEIHLLGYFPLESDLEYGSAFESLREVLEEYRFNKVRQNESMILAMDAAGIRGRDRRLSVEGFYASARAASGSGNYNRVHIANYLMEEGVVSSKKEAFGRFIGKNCPFYIPCKRVPIKKAVEAIHTGGGTAVIAHVGEYKFEETRLEGFFEDSISWDIDGFELLHPHNTPETAESILAFAARFRRETGRVLLLTAGSDCHGENKLNRQGFPWDPAYAW